MQGPERVGEEDLNPPGRLLPGKGSICREIGDS